jgi:hypothetical protein
MELAMRYTIDQDEDCKRDCLEFLATLRRMQGDEKTLNTTYRVVR